MPKAMEEFLREKRRLGALVWMAIAD